MNNKIFWGIIGVLVIVVGVYFLTDSRTPSEETFKTTPDLTSSMTTTGTIPAATEQVVVYSNDGFAPAELTVKAGTKVTFVNQSDSPMWVASGPHPTHTLYPEFDQKASVQKGSSYSFIFTKLGTHPYHNHVLLGKYGKITVE